MKLFSRNKIIFIFLLAILLPALFAGYLSISTFPARREVIKKLLESNLWVSGDAAVKSIEAEILEREKRILNPENFQRLVRIQQNDRVAFISSFLSNDSTGFHFLLDPDLKPTVPETSAEITPEIQFRDEMKGSLYAQVLHQAEMLEFSGKDYPGAAELYRECVQNAPSGHLRAAALESVARCLLSSHKYDEAVKACMELSEGFGQIMNKAGHPYGITAMFHLYEIAVRERQEEHSLRIMLDLYKRINEGNWLISKPVYDFFTAESEAILNNQTADGRFPEIQESWNALYKQALPYKQFLRFTGFLEKVLIPEISGKLSLSGEAGEWGTSRFMINAEDSIFLISFTHLQDFLHGRKYYGGICWNLNLLGKKIIPEILMNVSKETGLDFDIKDRNDAGIDKVNSEPVPGELLTLAFRVIPLPWDLQISHPESKEIEKTARREIFMYGSLFTLIVVLMLLGAVLIARDIKRESETSQMKTDFVNNISHELKTPLTLIRLYGETLQRKENLSSAEKKECYEIITKESERLSHLIDNVLDFSRIETGRKEFVFKKGYLQDVINETLESYRYHLENKGFLILCDIGRDLPEMNFDGEAIASVLVNLLSNAIKFSTKVREVTVRLFTEKGNAVLQVTDKGIGISPEEIPKIFRRFYRSASRSVAETRGSGIGLTLVRHIVEAHGGNILAESEPGKGSTFTVRIPLG